MELSTVIIFAVVIVLLMYSIVIYNNLVSLKHNVSKSRANIDVLLKQRHTELPKLVASCKQYMQHERQTLEDVINARNSVKTAQDSNDMNALGKAESSLRNSLGKLFALAEGYPELKADRSFVQLQQRISHLEETIADRRELYNDSVNLNNARIEQFPDVLLARAFAFKEFELLKFSEVEIADVNINQMFNS
jgi:LemA protein